MLAPHQHPNRDTWPAPHSTAKIWQKLKKLGHHGHTANSTCSSPSSLSSPERTASDCDLSLQSFGLSRPRWVSSKRTFDRLESDADTPGLGEHSTRQGPCSFCIHFSLCLLLDLSLEATCSFSFQKQCTSDGSWAMSSAVLWTGYQVRLLRRLTERSCLKFQYLRR